MPIPDYQSVFLPLLKLASNRAEHSLQDAISALTKDFGLSEEERAKLLPSGRQPIFYNRVQWAKTYLVQAGLLEATKRSHFRITERGSEVLKSNPSRIDIKFLDQFPEFTAFRAGRKKEETEQVPAALAATTVEQTPDEILRSTVSGIENALAVDLLGRILAAPHEELIVSLLLSMGYGGSREEAGRAIGKSGDGGLDGVIDQDPLGLDRVYVQAKRYNPNNAVSEPEIRGFSGSLGAAKANKGVFVTTSFFTRPAKDFAERHPFKMVLIDGEQLTSLMIPHNVGVRVSETLYLKKIDEDFFLDD